MTYYLFNVIYSWFMVGNFCLAFTIVINKKFNPTYGQDTKIKSDTNYNGDQMIGNIIILIYISILIILFIISLGVKPARIRDFYKILSLALGGFQFYVLYLTVSFLANNQIDNEKQVVIALCAVVVSFALIVILNCEVWSIFKGAFHYIFLMPTYVNIFLIYSICNVHDCTWGNRPDALSAEEKDRLEEFEEFRTRCCIIWVFATQDLLMRC